MWTFILLKRETVKPKSTLLFQALRLPIANPILSAATPHRSMTTWTLPFWASCSPGQWHLRFFLESSSLWYKRNKKNPLSGAYLPPEGLQTAYKKNKPLSQQFSTYVLQNPVWPKTLSDGLQGGNCFHNNTKMVFAFTILTFAQMVQKQQWVKSLVQPKSSQWHQIVLSSNHIPHLHAFTQFKKKVFHLRIFMMML